MKRLIVIFFTCLTVNAFSRSTDVLLEQGQVYVGLKAGVGIPIALGTNEDKVNFSKVAAYGFTGGAEVLWLSTPMLGVGGEVNFANYPYRQEFWSGLAFRGSFDANYKDISAGVNGRVIMGKKKVKPYAGINVSANYIRNMLEFTQNDVFTGSREDQSVDYIYQKIHVGGGIDIGIYYKIGPNAVLTITARLNIIPAIKGDQMKTIDSYTGVERTVVVNPHGNENNLAFTLGLHFITRSYINHHKK